MSFNTCCLLPYARFIGLGVHHFEEIKGIVNASGCKALNQLFLFPLLWFWDIASVGRSKGRMTLVLGVSTDASPPPAAMAPGPAGFGAGAFPFPLLALGAALGLALVAASSSA
jgi:hypothetical protein